jgi:hypothetical protein
LGPARALACEVNAPASTTMERQSVAVNGSAAMRIAVAQDADPISRNAATELATYLRDITGGDFAVLSDTARQHSGPMIVVGRNNDIARALICESAYEGLGPDGFIIRSAGPHIVIAGLSSRGTMYGVNWFLDRILGVRWLAPRATFVPRQPTIVLPRLNERKTPRFAFREVLSDEAQDKRWRAHNLMNGESHGPSFLPSPPEIKDWDNSWNAKGTVANFYDLLPPAVHRKAHPDWYAGGQLAMMNPEMRAEMAAAVVKRLRALPDYRSVWYAVHDMDWGWDMDAASRAFAARHGGHPSAPRLDMMIDVANRVRAELPDARLAFNAYHWSFTPPLNMTVPDYIRVYPMTIQVDYRTALNEETNEALGRDLLGWSKISDNLLVWDHVANFSGYIQPTPNLRAIGRSIKWLATLKSVTGYFAEGVWDTPGGEFSALRAWLIARLLWDPDQNIDELIRDFCDKYYGPAGKAVAKYIDLAEAAIAKSGDRLTEKTSIDAKMFDLAFVEAADKLFDEAEAATTEGSYLPRVRHARLPIDYVILSRRREYEDALSQRPTGWNLNLEARSKRFWLTVAASGLKNYYQGGPVAALRDVLSIERTRPTLPPALQTVGAGDVVDLQDQSMTLFGNARTVSDPSASDGAAIRMNPKSGGWFVQLKLDRLPRNGSWRLLAAVRAEGGTESTSAALNVGSTPPMNCFATLDTGTTSGSQYVLVNVPGGPFEYSTDHQKSVYFQPRNSPSMTGIFVDRILAIRSDAKIDVGGVVPGATASGCRPRR